MKLSPISEELMKEFLNNFNQLSIKNTVFQRKQMDNIFKLLFNTISAADKYIHNLKLLGKVKSHIQEFAQEKEIPYTELFNSHFVTKSVREYVIKHIKGYLIFETEILNHKIHFYFALLQADDLLKSRRFEKYLNYALMWLYMAILYAPTHCAQELNIFCFLTPFKKHLPKNQNNILSPEHCNSAVTTSCIKKGEICIYREEEFLKVLIHESFHIFGLDFSNLPTQKINKSIKKIFPIESEFNIFEAYSETWASILNALFCAYSFLDKNEGEEDFILYAEICVQCEQIFSLFQCSKVLNFMGIEYKNLFERDVLSYNMRKYLYREKTNVFSYYIIRSIIMFNLYKFLTWCKNNNSNLYNFHKSIQNIDSFGEFIRSNYKNKDFQEKLKILNEFKLNIENKQVYGHNHMLINTLRMSLCEMG